MDEGPPGQRGGEEGRHGGAGMDPAPGKEDRRGVRGLPHREARRQPDGRSHSDEQRRVDGGPHIHGVYGYSVRLVWPAP